MHGDHGDPAAHHAAVELSNVQGQRDSRQRMAAMHAKDHLMSLETAMRTRAHVRRRLFIMYP